MKVGVCSTSQEVAVRARQILSEKFSLIPKEPCRVSWIALADGRCWFGIDQQVIQKMTVMFYTSN